MCSHTKTDKVKPMTLDIMQLLTLTAGQHFLLIQFLCRSRNMKRKMSATDQERRSISKPDDSSIKRMRSKSISREPADYAPGEIEVQSQSTAARIYLANDPHLDRSEPRSATLRQIAQGESIASSEVETEATVTSHVTTIMESDSASESTSSADVDDDDEEDDDDDTSSSSSSEDDSEDEDGVSDIAQGLVGKAEEDTSSEDSSSSDDETIIPLRPHVTKPNFSVDDIKNNPLKSTLATFMDNIAKANAQLEADKAAGNLPQGGFELSSDAEQGEGSGQYIEMNLGLGVLQEKDPAGSSTSEESDSTLEDGDVLGKLLAVQGQGPEQERTDRKKKVLVEEV